MFFWELLVYLFWVVIFGGFLVLFTKVSEWYDDRFLDNKIGGWLSTQDYIFVQLFPPAENLRSLAEMENFFINIASIFSSKSKKDVYKQGKWYEGYAFEIHSRGGQIGFFCRLNRNYLPLFRSSLSAHYPGSSVVECLDPIGHWPKEWTGKIGEYEHLYSTDISMGASDLFPLKSWKHFQRGSETPITDPISVLISAMQDIDPGDYILLQYIVVPYSPSLDGSDKRWKSELQNLKKELATNAVSETTEAGEVQLLTTQEKEIINAVENKISSENFRTKIRVTILSDKPGAVRLLNRVTNFFKEFASEKQFLKPNADTKTNITDDGNRFGPFGPSLGGWLDEVYWKNEQRHREKMMYKATVGRSLSKGANPSLFDAESLAALFHFPTTFLGSDKGIVTRVSEGYENGQMTLPASQPPSNLPT